MADLIVSPVGPLRGEVAPDGDKSLSHRAALFAALAEGESRIDNYLVAGVTNRMLECLRASGVLWKVEDRTLTVVGKGLRGLQASDQPLNCGNSGTTMRLLAGALACSGCSAVLDGSEGLRRRPMSRIVEPLKKMGVPIEGAGDGGTAPLAMETRPPERKLIGIEHDLPIASAQVKSAILLAALAAEGPTVVREPARSRDHTERLLRGMGVRIDRDNESNSVTLYPPGSPLPPLNMTLPGDFSSAAFLMVAASIVPGSEIKLRGVGLNTTRTGLLDAMKTMGADIEVKTTGEMYGEPTGDLTVRFASLSGTEVSGELVVRMIDEFPALAVAAAFARGKTVVRDAGELRFKESDRIRVLCGELRALGIEALERDDGMVVTGGPPPPGGTVRHHGDHRIAMALSLTGLVSRGDVRIEDASVINESFPSFEETLASLGASVHRE